MTVLSVFFIVTSALACERADLFGFSREFSAAESRLVSRRGEWDGGKWAPPHSSRRLADRGSSAKILARNHKQLSLLAGYWCIGRDHDVQDWTLLRNLRKLWKFAKLRRIPNEISRRAQLDLQILQKLRLRITNFHNFCNFRKIRSPRWAPSDIFILPCSRLIERTIFVIFVICYISKLQKFANFRT